MKNKIVSILAASAMTASLLAGAVPMTALADGTMVVSIGADLTEDQRTAILKYFGIYGNNSVQTITVNNQDERNHLSSYIPIEQIGSRTISCALVKPTTSGGVQVKTANLNYITSNMIASNLVTCGVTNCQAIAAAPFEVSGTGALTGVLMAYENATGTQISQEAKDLSAQEIQVTEDLSNSAENQQVAQQIVNDVKLQVIDGVADESINLEEVDNSDNSVTNVDNSQVSNIVNNVVNNYTTTNNGVTLTEQDVQQLNDYAQRLAEQAYQQGVDDARAQLEAQAQIQANIETQTGVQSSDTTQKIVSDAGVTQPEQAQTEAAAAESGSAETEAPADIFANTDVSALNSGDTSNTLVTGTDQSVISNDTASGAQDNDANISEAAQSETTAETTANATAETDASGLVITTTDSSQQTELAPETGADGTSAEDAVIAETNADGTPADAAAASGTNADGTAADAAAEAETQAAEETAQADLTITGDQTDSYSASYLQGQGMASVPAFSLAVKSDNLVPVSGTLTVADESGNVLGTADLSDSAQVTAVSSGAANDEFKTDFSWDQLTGLFFQPKDTSGNTVLPEAGMNYLLSLSGVFAQTSDPAVTDGAPTVALDLQNVSFTAPQPAGFSLTDTALGSLTAGANVSAALTDDGSFLNAAFSSPDGSAVVSTVDGTGILNQGGDMSASVTLQSAGLAEVDVNYTAADGVTVTTLRFFIPVQA